ncbi:MAG: hypothetical protein JW814_00475 [Candidatus Krumholzibacteriota bacterium]|nr:hypothetical protein [Candidatus Krumholzibacteriota bacterium]
MRNFLQAGSLAIICIVLLITFADSMAGDKSCQSTEYELMSMLITSEYESEFSPVLINRDTELWCIAERLDILQKEWPGLKSETIDSLIAINRGPAVRLTGQFCIPVDYKLVSEEEYADLLGLRNIFKAGEGSGVAGMGQHASAGDRAEPDWNNFDRVFPEAQGYLTFSRIAFDSDRTQALVIFCNAYRCNGVRTKPATRRIACFMKKGGTWKLSGISRSINTMY